MVAKSRKNLGIVCGLVPRPHTVEDPSATFYLSHRSQHRPYAQLFSHTNQYSFASLKSSFKVSPTLFLSRHRRSGIWCRTSRPEKNQAKPSTLKKTSSTTERQLHLHHFSLPRRPSTNGKADLLSTLEDLFGFAIMGISRDSRHKRSATGAKRAYYRKKR